MSRTRKKRSPRKPIGAQKIQSEERKVTNKADWRPKNPERVKRGHQ
jgi:hypothetical protein